MPSRGPQPPTLGSAAASSTSSASGSSSRQRRGHPRGPRGDQERGRVAGDDQRRRERDGRPRPPGEQPVAHVAGRGAAQPRPPGPAGGGPRARRQRDDGRRREERERDERHGRPHGRRHDEQHGDGEHDLHDLPGRALPRHGAQPAADVARVAAVADPAVDVAHHAAGQRDVEEERAVVRGHRRAQRQVDAEAAGHDPPAPGAAHGGQHGEAGRGRQRPAVDRAQAVEERARAHVPDQDGERRDAWRRGGRPVVTAAPAGRHGRR